MTKEQLFKYLIGANDLKIEFIYNPYNGIFVSSNIDDSNGFFPLRKAITILIMKKVITGSTKRSGSNWVVADSATLLSFCSYLEEIGLIMTKGYKEEKTYTITINNYDDYESLMVKLQDFKLSRSIKSFKDFHD
jgi:hypothetical protein